MSWRGWRAGRLRAEEERPPQTGPSQSREEPLPSGLRNSAERSLGVPLSTVRMLRGRGSESLARQHGARSLTDGRSIVTGPETDESSLAHELVHVAQFRRSGPSGTGVSSPGDASEREARRLAPAVLAGIPVGDTHAKPSAGMQRDELKPDTSRPASRAKLSRRDLAGYAPTPKDWESQFDPQVLAPDPSVKELERNYSARQAADKSLPDKTGIDLALEWAADLTSFKKREARRYKIDQLLEQMIRELPEEIWLPDANVISQSANEKESLTVTGATGPYSPEPLRNKLYTMLVYMRDIKVDANDPTGLIWDDDLSWSRMTEDPTAQPEPFRLNSEPFTQLEDRTLRTFFGAEMKEWSRRAVAVDESAEKEKDRRGGLVTAGVAAASEKFVYVALAGSAAVGTGAALVAPAAAAWEGTSLAAGEFSLSTALRLAPRLTGWALTHPYATAGILGAGVGIGHDVYSGEFSFWSLLLHGGGAYGGYLADEGNLSGGGTPAAPQAAPEVENEPPTPKPAAPAPPAAPQQTAVPEVPENVTDAPPPSRGTGLPRTPLALANSPFLRNILISFKMGVTNTIPATAGTGGGSGPVGDRPVPALTTGGGGGVPTAPTINVETAPGTTVAVPAAPAPVVAPTAPAAPPVAAGPAAPVPAGPAAPIQLPVVPGPATGVQTPAGPVQTPTTPVTTVQQPQQTPVATQQQAPVLPNAEAYRGVQQDQRAWLKELFGGNFTTGLRDVLGVVWARVARPGDQAAILRLSGRRQYNLATYYYHLQRARFWRAVRRDPNARAMIEAAGGRFRGSDTSAPVIVLPDGTTLEITIDHNVQRSDDPTLALDPNNLSLSSRRENTIVLRLLHVLDPFVNVPWDWWPFDPEDE